MNRLLQGSSDQDFKHLRRPLIRPLQLGFSHACERSTNTAREMSADFSRRLRTAILNFTPNLSVSLEFVVPVDPEQHLQEGAGSLAWPFGSRFRPLEKPALQCKK